MTVAFPADFYGADGVPFQRHLGMGLRRERPDGPATVSLAPRAEVVEGGDEQSPAAVFTVAEVAAAICAADAVWQHDPDGFSEMMPVLLTTGARFQLGAGGRGEITASATFGGDGAAILERLRRVRKASLAVDVEVRDEADQLAGVAEVDIYLRLMNRESFDAMLAPETSGS